MRSRPAKLLLRSLASLISVATLATSLAAPRALAQIPAPAQTAAKRPITFADLQKIKRIADPQISPSGKWVMFSVTDVSLENNTKTNHLWVVPLTPGPSTAQTGSPERQLTFGTGETNGRFSPDGKQVLFTASKEHGSQLWLAPWDEAGGKLGPWRRLTAVATEADGGLWSPDSQRILFVSSVYPTCSDKLTFAEEDACNKAKDAAAQASPVKAQIFDHLLFRHWNQYTGEKRSHILVVSAADGTQVRDLTPRSAVGDAETPTFSLGGPLGYSWAPDSHEIAYVTNLDEVPAASTNNDIFTLQLDNPNAKATKISTSRGSDDGPQYSPDGKYLAFRSQARAGYESDRFRLMLYNRQSRGLREADLPLKTYSGPPVIMRQGSKSPASGVEVSEQELDRWVDEFIWSADSQHIFFTAADHGQEVIYRTNVPSGNLHRFGRFKGSAMAGEWSSLILIGPGDRLGGVLMKVDKPAELAIANMSEMDDSGFINMPVVSKDPSAMRMYNLRPGVPLAAPNYLTHLNEPLTDQLQLPLLEPFTFPGADNTLVQGFLLRPPNFDPTKKYPLKFLIHGGPQGAWGDAWSYRWNPELFASSGYVVVMINPRGSTGYGQKFIDEINGDWGGKPYIDLMRGLSYAEQHFPFIDKTRECALGASYGGFMANWILTHPDPQHPDRFSCIVTHDGMFNPTSAYGTTEELWFNEWEFRRPGTTTPGQPWRYASGPIADDPFRKWSPMLSIQNAKTPTLVIHGQRDYRLDVSEGFQLFTALQRLGVPSKMLYFPDEGHWVLKPQNSELWYKTVDDWCDRWTHTNHYAQPAAATAQASSTP